MSAHAYTEDQQAPGTLTQPLLCGAPSPLPLPWGEGVEQPAIGLFAEYSAGPNPHPRPSSHSANPHPCLSQWERSREKGDRQAGLRVRSLVLVPRLRAALERLNPALPPEVITTAVDELSKLWRGPGGRAEGYGLKCFPEKNEGPPGSPSSPSPNG